jgi:hypothetical protein
VPAGAISSSPLAGQSAALVHDVLPAAGILRRTVDEAEQALHRALGTIVSDPAPPAPGPGRPVPAVDRQVPRGGRSRVAGSYRSGVRVDTPPLAVP